MRVNFDITQSLLELSELEITVPEKVGVSLISSAMIDERRKLLQRGLNLEDAASSLLDYMKTKGRKISGEKAVLSSDTAIELSLSEYQTNIDSVSALTAINTGSFNINGVDFQIDTSSESLEDIIDKINAADAGVKASFDFEDGEVVIESKRQKAMFFLNGSSNFFTGANLKDGYVAGENGIDRKAFLESDPVQLRFSRFTSRFNHMMAVDFETARLGAFEANIQSLLRSGVNKYFDKSFTSGTLRLASNAELTLNSEQTKFTRSKIAFTTDDSPANFFDFLEASDGILSALSSFSGNESDKLKENINAHSSTGLIIDKKI